MKMVWFFWVGVAIFWTGMFMLAKFPPTESELLLRYAGWSKYTATSLPANFAAELPYPIPTAVVSLVSPAIPVTLFWFRAVNLVFGLAVFLLLVKLVENKYVLALAASSLGLQSYVMFDLPLVITTVIALGMTWVWLRMSEGRNKYLLLWFLGLWAAQTSWYGYLWVAVFAIMIFPNVQKKLWLMIGAGMILVFSFRNDLGQTALRIDPNVGARVDLRVRYETKLNNYQEPIPLSIKRLVYNKPYFAWREVVWNLGQKLAIESWSFPGQQDATVARNLWGSKGLAWVNFWLWPLLILAMTKWKEMKYGVRFTVGVLAIWGFVGSGTGFILAMMVIIGSLVQNARPVWKTCFWIALTLTTIPNFYHFLTHEQIWRDNRPMVHTIMAQMAQRHKGLPAGRQGTQVTTILGRSFLYYGWLNQIPPEEFWRGVEVGMTIRGVKFDHFEKPTNPGVYVGLPGELLGNKAEKGDNAFRVSELPTSWEMLESAETRDTVSFGNGDAVWAVKAN